MDATNSSCNSYQYIVRVSREGKVRDTLCSFVPSGGWHHPLNPANIWIPFKVERLTTLKLTHLGGANTTPVDDRGVKKRFIRDR